MKQFSDPVTIFQEWLRLNEEAMQLRIRCDFVVDFADRDQVTFSDLRKLYLDLKVKLEEKEEFEYVYQNELFTALNQKQIAGYSIMN
jgi:aspartyl/asparaginyl beta-hydroxylase (cupin superfamily)